MNYRFKLDTSSKKFTCPSCGKRRFVRFIDNESGEYMPPEFGRCDREINCGYFNIPATEGKGAPLVAPPRQKEPPPSFIPHEIFSKSRGHYQENAFVRFLVKTYGEAQAMQAVSRYHIGTSKHWPGACVFWQIDAQGRVHAGKIMLYDANGRRERGTPPTWAHKALKLEPFNLKQCLFGEHLLKMNPGFPVAIVESEKTAIIASLHFPKINWLAAGGLNNLGCCKGLRGRSVTLYPDLGAFELWAATAEKLSQEFKITFKLSDCLERIATAQEREKQLDIADYLLKSAKGEKSEAPEKTFFFEGGPWDLTELETFAKQNLPTGPVKVTPWETIVNVPLFVQNTLEVVRANNGNPTYEPYLESLKELKTFLNNN